MAARGVDGTWAMNGGSPQPDGTLKTPWGEGTRGVIPPDKAEGKDRLFVDFAGTKHTIEEARVEKGGEVTMTSTRCNDGEKVDVVL